MQQPNNSSCRLFTITYVANITFEFNLEQSIHNLLMRLHLHNNTNNKTIYIFIPQILAISQTSNALSTLVSKILNFQLVTSS